MSWTLLSLSLFLLIFNRQLKVGDGFVVHVHVPAVGNGEGSYGNRSNIDNDSGRLRLRLLQLLAAAASDEEDRNRDMNMNDNSRNNDRESSSDDDDNDDDDDRPMYRSNLQKIIQANRSSEARERIIQSKKRNKRPYGAVERGRSEMSDTDEVEGYKVINYGDADEDDDNVGDDSIPKEFVGMGMDDEGIESFQAEIGAMADMMDVDIREAEEPEAEAASIITTNEEYSIDSFLMGEYDRPFSEDAAAPHPGLKPRDTVEAALQALRDLDVPNPSHGAAVFLRFTAPLSRSDRWGGSVQRLSPWKEIVRGSLTPTMLARRIRASEEFSVLLDWQSMDVTEGMAVPGMNVGSVTGSGSSSTVAFVNCSLFFGDGVEPVMVQFTLFKMSGVWLIDSAVRSKKEWFYEE